MELNEEIMKRFIAGDCEEEEEYLVLERLREHPNYFKQYLLQHPAILDEKYSQKLSEKLTSRLFEEIHFEIDRKQKKASALVVRFGTIAAILAITLGCWYFGLFSPKQNTSTFLVIESKVIQRNLSDTVQHWSLPDHSSVKAEPGAVLTYSKSFNKIKREVNLTGEAEFNIVHNEKRPFIVYSSKITTTVLGTRFSVKTNQEKIEVKLYEGKVMVKNISGKALKPFYLDPGNGIIYTISTGKFLAISNFNGLKNIKSRNRNIKQVAKSGSDDDNIMDFDNTSMEFAIDKLAEKYEVEIQYSPADIEGVNLIAQISKKQPLIKILTDIALTNGLNVKKAGQNIFIIEKNK